MCEDQKQKIWVKCKKELFEHNASPECLRPCDDRVLTVPLFDRDGDWPAFLEKLQLYFKDNNVQGDRRVAVLLTCISQSIYSDVQKICKPDQPNNKSYKQLISLIGKLLSSKSNVWRERIKFFKLKQGQESAGDWLNRVLEAASHCLFGDFHEEHVKNKFVCGLRSGPVLDGLCEEEFSKPYVQLLNNALRIEKSIPSTSLQPLKLENNYLTKFHNSDVPLRQSPRRLASMNKENYCISQDKPTSYTQQYLNALYSRDRRGTKRPHSGDDDNDAPAPPCLCGLTSQKLTVRREGPNQGREFFVCPKDEGKCSLYVWADEVQYNIKCHCQLIAKKLTVRKEGPNQGRQFFACPKAHGDSDRCQFFVWADEAESGGSGRDRGTQPSGGRSRQSYGSSNNSRPTPAKKSKTTNSKTKTPSAYRATGGKETTKTRKCGVCGQPGHNRKNCPQND